MNWARALAVWLLIVVAESIHGTVRQLFIAPAIGDLPARQIGVATGSVIIFVIAWVCIRWIGAGSFSQQICVGLLWIVLISIFEFGLGMALGYTKERLLLDYDLAKGGYMGFGLLFMLFAPVLAAKARGGNTSSRRSG